MHRNRIANTAGTALLALTLAAGSGCSNNWALGGLPSRNLSSSPRSAAIAPSSSSALGGWGRGVDGTQSAEVAEAAFALLFAIPYLISNLFSDDPSPP